jgi:hypothetical protein
MPGDANDLSASSKRHTEIAFAEESQREALTAGKAPGDQCGDIDVVERPRPGAIVGHGFNRTALWLYSGFFFTVRNVIE